MKHRLIIPVLLLMAIPVRAQFDSFDADASTVFPLATDSSVVRVFENQYAIGFIRDGGAYNYFYASDVSGFGDPGMPCLSMATKVDVPAGLVVHDIVFAGQRAYFCGQTPTTGVYGWFEVPELLYSAVVHINYAPISGLNKLRKMVVVDPNPTASLIIAVGDDGIYDHMVRINQGKPFEVMQLPAWGATGAGQVDDLLVCSDTLYFIGSDKNTNTSSSAFYISKAYTYPSLNPTEIGRRYIYESSSAVFLPVQGSASAMTINNQIAVAHGAIESHGVYVRLALINSQLDMTCVSVQSFQGDRSNSYIHLELMSLTADVVLTLKNIGLTKYVALHPYLLTPYLTTIYRSALSSSISSTRLGGNSQISSSDNRWEIQRFNTVPPDSCCHPYVPINVNIGQPYSRKIENMPVLQWVQPFLPSSFSNSTSQFDIHRTCIY